MTDWLAVYIDDMESSRHEQDDSERKIKAAMLAAFDHYMKINSGPWHPDADSLAAVTDKEP